MGNYTLYYTFVFIAIFIALYKNRNSLLRVVIILCFSSGLVAYPGKLVENPYKIILVLCSVYLTIQERGFSKLRREEEYLLIIFGVFSLSFFYSAISNDDYFNLIMSQYGKLVTPICIFLILNRLVIKNHLEFIYLKRLFFTLLTIQIVLSIAKVLLLGLQESFVGSIAFIGGGPATIIPILGFILLWLHRQGTFKTKDWLYLIALMFIPFTSIKRAIWFIMPTFLALFFYYVPRKLKTNYVFFVLFLVFVIFYLGVRLNPTLNKEGKIGGKFDLQYVLTFTQNYSFGDSSKISGSSPGSGRGGATILLIQKLFDNEELSGKDFWGYGLQEFYTTDYEGFDDEKFRINSKGAATGIFQTYISSGYIGVILTICLLVSICFLVKEPRIRNSIAILLFWDYLFYSGLILKTQSLFVLLFFIIVYSNIQFDQKLYKRYLSKSQSVNF
jgi:hypothetical protein